jgi:hypothetical protein
VVDVPGQQPGLIPGLETILDVGKVMNGAKLSFTAPNAGWPNGHYQLQVLLLDATGAQKDEERRVHDERQPAGRGPAGRRNRYGGGDRRTG